MHNKEHSKRKIDLMKSIMSNPKLSKTMKDALNAPIGSTKRTQAKSIFSIMRKVHGIQHDGQGGPDDGSIGLTGSSTLESNTGTTTPDYSNMTVYPAAKLKSSIVEGTTAANTADTWNPEEHGGIVNTYKGYSDFMNNNVKPLATAAQGVNIGGLATVGQFVGQNTLAALGNLGRGTLRAFAPDKDLPDVGIDFVSPQDTWGGKFMSNMFSTPESKESAQALRPWDAKAPFSQAYYSDGSPVYTVPAGATQTNTNIGAAPAATDDKTKILAIQNALVKAGYMTADQLATGPGIWGPQSKAAYAKALADQNGGTSPSGNGTSSSSSSTTSTGGSSPTTTTSDPYGMQSAINRGEGATSFAMDFADQKFGGGLDQYIANLDNKLKTDFNLKPLEESLTNLKNEKANLIPTLQTYMKGKDQYLKFIDQMIDTTQGNMLNHDMSNPAVAARYQQYQDYLYTLKGRQEQRYGTYLNGAVADYQAELDKSQSNYDSAYKDYQAAMTQQGTMAQNQYNNLITRMQAAYTDLQNAPTIRDNATLLHNQVLASNLSLAQNGLKQGDVTNPKYQADLAAVVKDLSNGGTGANKDDLNWNNIQKEGLAGLYAQNVHSGSDEAALTEGIRRVLSATIQNNTDSTTSSKIKQLITDLQAKPATATYGNYLNSELFSGSSGYSAEILPKIGEVKNAINDLVKPGGGFLGFGQRKPGVQDKASWLSAHASLGTPLLEALYTSIAAQLQPGGQYASNPDTLINTLFSGKDDKTNANLISSVISA